MSGCYSIRELVTSWFPDVDKKWPPEYLFDLTKTADQPGERKNTPGQEWKDFFLKESEVEDGESEHLATKKFIARQHPHGNIGLAALRQKLYATIELLDSLGTFVHELQELSRADALDSATSFTRILETRKEELIQFLKSAGADRLRDDLIKIFSHFADLIVIEDQSVGNKDGRCGAGGNQMTGILDLLAADIQRGQFFRLAISLFKERASDYYYLGRRLITVDIRATVGQNDALSRVIIVGHPNLGIRFEAATTAPVHVLWEVAAYPKTPIESLRVIAQSLKDGYVADAAKIFFDCIKLRLLNEIDVVDNREKFSLVCDLIDFLLTFDFFVETQYFQELETMVATLQLKLRKYPDVRNLSRNNLRAVEHMREQRGFPTATIPELVVYLPPAIQRHLARNGCYIEHFALSADYRIAREVEPYLTDDLIISISMYAAMRNRQINEKLLESLSGDRRLIYKKYYTPKQLAGGLSDPDFEQILKTVGKGGLTRRR